MIERLKTFLRANSRAIPVIIIALAVVGLLMMQAVAIARANEAIERTNRLTEQIAEAAKQRTKQIDSVNRNLDCIVKFFSQKDRSNKSIDQIKTCRISTDSENFTFNSSDGSSQRTAPQTSPRVKQQSPVSSNNSAPGQTPPREQLDQPTEQTRPTITEIPIIDGLLNGILGES